jgi:acyl-CoA thioesterase
MTHDIEAVKKYFDNDYFASANGMRLIELRPGFAKTSLSLDKRHLNSVGVVQGGAIFTLADFAFGAASNSAGLVAVGINASITFMKAAQTGTLFAEAVEESRTKRLSHCQVRVTDDAGGLIAVFQGTAYVKQESFPPKTA